MNAAAALRLAIVRSNAGPIRSGWDAGYRCSATAAASLMRARFPGSFDAIYLRRSLATGFIVPGLSDIDLLFVLRSEIDPSRHEDIKEYYRGLAKRFPVLDPEPEIFRWAEIRKLHAENPGFRFRAEEGRVTWQCLYGTDMRSDLPLCDRNAMAVAHAFNLKSRLPHFNDYFFFADDVDPLAAVRAEYLLYKIVLDCAQTAYFLRSEETRFDRTEIAAGFADSPNGTGAGPLAAPIVRDFVQHVSGTRLRESFFGRRAEETEHLPGTVLRLLLETLGTVYADADVRRAPEITAERDHFYDHGRCLLTGRPIAVADSHGRFTDLATTVRAKDREGTDTVVRAHGLLVNLSIREPGLGNCTAVLVPDGARAAVS